MPDFYNKMKDRLRSAEQGADTASWLAISDAALKHPSGLFFEGAFLNAFQFTRRRRHWFDSSWFRSKPCAHTPPSSLDAFEQRGARCIHDQVGRIGGEIPCLTGIQYERQRFLVFIRCWDVFRNKLENWNPCINRAIKEDVLMRATKCVYIGFQVHTKQKR